jgi:hypothetical protein
LLIHEQDEAWLIKNFSSGATKYPVNVSRLMRNIIWQIKERIGKGEREPLTELIRTFWYMYVKPTLSRAGALAKEVDQYKQLVEQLVNLVVDLDLMRYSQIGFRDDNEAHRRIGANANIILFSEKLGHQAFLSEIADQYKVSIIALGGQPSVVNSEYFVDTLRERSVNLQRSFYLFSIVDYDPSGWIIRDAFVNNLRFYGIKNIRMIDLVSPDILTPEEVLFSRYQIPDGKGMRKKNQSWIKQVHARKFTNQHLLEELSSKTLYGLEAESISTKRLREQLGKQMLPLIGQSESLLKNYELKKLDEAIRNLMLHKLTT